MSRYLVTGGAGFIASHIARSLTDGGHEVYIVDNLSTGFRENVPPAARLVDMDLSQPDFIAGLPDVSFDAVLHLAGQSSGEISFENPLYDLQTNVQSTLLLLDWCSRAGPKRFLYASSMSVYGDVEEAAITEEHPCRPKAFYGVGKLAAERYLDLFAERGLQTTAFRMFNVYGPGQNLANLKQGMISIYLAYVLRGQTLPIRGSKDRFRDFIYIDDVVNAWTAAIDNRATYGKVYNLGTGKPTRVWEVVDGLLAAFGYSGGAYPVEYHGPTPGDQFGIYADIQCIQTDLGWKPAVGLHEGLGRMVDWARGLETPFAQM